MPSNFLRPQIIRPTFSKTPNNQPSSFENKLDTKKMAWTMTYWKYQTPNNVAYPKFHTTDSTFGTSKFQTPNNLPSPNCKPQISTLASPFQKSRNPLPHPQDRNLFIKRILKTFFIKQQLKSKKATYYRIDIYQDYRYQYVCTLHCIAEIRAYWVETKPSEINAAFVCVHVVGNLTLERFSKDFLEARGLRVSASG